VCDDGLIFMTKSGVLIFYGGFSSYFFNKCIWDGEV
jgi:hypothetical protein